MLEIEHVEQYYGQSHILHDVSLSVPSGLTTCLMGRNGTGKTTLLKAVMGLLPIKEGKILFEGKDISHLTPEKRAALGIGYVPQGRQIFPLLTVEENLQICLPLNKRNSHQIPPLIYEFFPVLREMRHRRGGDLSGGQQQQLAIGRALAADPKILILDEPTEGIQPNIVSDIAASIKALNERMGLTVLVVEQKVGFVRKLAHRFAIMQRGQIVQEGEVRELSDELIARYLNV